MRASRFRPPAPPSFNHSLGKVFYGIETSDPDRSPNVIVIGPGKLGKEVDFVWIDYGAGICFDDTTQVRERAIISGKAVATRKRNRDVVVRTSAVQLVCANTEMNGLEGFSATLTYKWRSNRLVNRIDGTDVRMPQICTGTSAFGTIVGTQKRDTIQGTDGNDIIDSRGGNDTVDAGAGHDIVCAGAGNDRVRGGDGVDLILGQQGSDLRGLRGGPDQDVILGGVGRDRLIGEEGADVHFGGGGRDRCIKQGADVQFSCP